MTETLREVSHRRVLKIAAPIVLSNATVPILGAVDTGVVGQMGLAAPIGAVGVGAVMLTSVYWIFGFLRMGTTGFVSQAAGAGDRSEVAALLTRVLMIALIGGLALIALQGLIFDLGFRLAPASDEVEALAHQYMSIRIWSAPAPIALYGITGWLIAQERTRAVLVLQVWMNGVNILLDLWFVLGLGLGVGGVAFATFLAEWSGLLLGLWLCRGAFATPAWRAAERVFDRVKLVRMASVNGDILVRSILLEAVFLSFLFLAADLGDVTLAANQILLQFLHITAYALDGFAFAAETLVGQAFGAGAVARLRRSAVLASVWGGIVSVAMALGYVLGGSALIDLMTTAPEVREAARSYLGWVALAPLLGVAPFMLDGIFVGATRTRDMRNMMMLSALGYFGCVAVLLPLMGNHGLWASLMAMFVLRAVTLGARYPALERAAVAG
jgi:MATE family multidrug resistance protein